jgi:hypothetical protein
VIDRLVGEIGRRRTFAIAEISMSTVLDTREPPALPRLLFRPHLAEKTIDLLAQRELLVSVDARIALIKRLEKLRGSTVICYLTSVRQNVAAAIADDQVRALFDHLQMLPDRPVEKLDLLLVSNGGSGTVPWRITAVLREFAKRVGVLLPYRAYSAATMIALGADEIVMHPFAEMGPIDPTVQNQFNPRDTNGHTIGIGVEDVSSYIRFVKETVGITHEDELIEALRALTDKVHPLALGNVERFLAQSRMIAKKILKTHMIEDSDDHVIKEIVENMASRLYFHGHPINRIEAQRDLKLKVAKDVPAELEGTMWDLYRLYETEFQNLVPHNPVGDILRSVQQAIAAGTAPVYEREYELNHACIESARLSSWNYSTRRYTLAPAAQQLSEDWLEQVWRHTRID